MNIYKIRKYFRASSRAYSKLEDVPEEPKNLIKSHTMRMNHLFRKYKHLQEIKQYIPTKYLRCKRKTLTDNLYLICPEVAKKVVSHMMPSIENNSEQVICETNAGLGFITNELLDRGVPLVRLYESCSEFRQMLKDFDKKYPGRVEIFTKDLFLLHRYAWIDKQDNCNRVEMLLRNTPKKTWCDDPCMTVVGPMSKLDFIKHLIKVLCLQTDVVNYGRIQLFALMRPRDFLVLSATPENNLHTYKWITVLFKLFFDYELLEKFPKEVFLPWETAHNRKSQIIRYVKQIDPDSMYLVRINFKKDLPVPLEHLLPLYFFVQNFFLSGTQRIIPTIEKWVPGSGLNILIPKLQHAEYFREVDIFTRFGDLTPQHLLGIFREIRNDESYESSPFKAMVEANLLKIETVETDVNDRNATNNKVLDEEIEMKIRD